MITVIIPGGLSCDFRTLASRGLLCVYAGWLGRRNDYGWWACIMKAFQLASMALYIIKYTKYSRFRRILRTTPQILKLYVRKYLSIHL